MDIQNKIESVLEIYNNNIVFKGDTNKPALKNNFKSIINLFSMYACSDFAYATHINTGWKVFQIDFFIDNEQEYAPYHIVVKKPDSDLYFDVSGFSTFEELIKKYDGNIEYAEIYEINPCPSLITDKNEINLISNMSDILRNKHEIKLNFFDDEFSI